MIRTTLAACALALLAACQQPAGTTEQPAAASEAPATAPAPAGIAMTSADEGAAFQAAWGSAPPVTWRAPDAKPDDETMTYSKGTLVPLGGDRFALVSEGQGGEGHVSAGALAVHYLTRTPAGFTRTGAWPNIISGGTFGSPPQWLIRTDLTPAPALVTEAGGTWQGYSCSWSDVVELTPRQPIVRTEGIPVGYDDSGAKEQGAADMEGTLSPDIKGQSFSVRYSGDRTGVVRYALRGQRYEATTKPDLLTC
ncbi:hypothetical protein ACETK8_02240 [Brevundimonas staleyi]|uniref:Lipoprotein n=1 Tax=Brevundimonas staleyi TaxID=74326 RepID=A0ABW0FUF6_9CAUL